MISSLATATLFARDLLNVHCQGIWLLGQIVHLGSVVQPGPGDRFLSLLPPWHMYERSAEYFALSRGVSQVYTSVKTLKVQLLLNLLLGLLFHFFVVSVFCHLSHTREFDV